MTYKRGYIAIVSVILLGTMILFAVLEEANTNYLGRFAVLRAEKKEESEALARSCLQMTLVRLAQNPDYRPVGQGDNLRIGQDNCRVVSIQSIGPEEIVIRTAAIKDEITASLESLVHFTGTDIGIDSTKRNVDF